MTDPDLPLETAARPNRSEALGARLAGDGSPRYEIFLAPKRGRLELKPGGRELLYDLFVELRDAAQRRVCEESGRDAFHAPFLERIGTLARSFVQRQAFRVISVPDENTKARQRVILRRLERIPVHRAAFGFVRGRGPRDCAQAHLAFHGPAPRGLLLLNADAQNFFHSVGEIVVRNALCGHGMMEAEVASLTGRCLVEAGPDILCKLLGSLYAQFLRTGATGQLAFDSNWLGDIFLWLTENNIDQLQHDKYLLLLLQTLLGVGPSVRLGERFLPQGAPTSPCLANLACKLIDLRLEAMAKAFGAFYTRYADDFVFSWKIPAAGKIKGKTVDGLKRCAAEVIAEYGLVFNPAKVRVLSPKYAQDIVGYLINSGRVTIPRAYRRNVRRDLNALVDRPPDEFQRELDRLGGCAGHIASAHPQEAAALRRLLDQRRDHLTPVRGSHGPLHFSDPTDSDNPNEPDDHEIPFEAQGRLPFTDTGRHVAAGAPADVFE